MRFNFLYFCLYVVIAWFFVSCSKESLQKMGVTKRKANQFAVARKAPLEMPPDMLLRPPQSTNETKNNNLSSDSDQLSLDDILNNKANEKGKKFKTKTKKLPKEKRILNKILNTKATELK